MTKEELKIKNITKKFGGICKPQVQLLTFANPITVKTRADALDILFLLQLEGWQCDLDKPLEALKRFIERE